MAHNIDQSNNRSNIAFLGSRNDIWHRLGQEMKEGQSIEEWAKQAGLDWTAIKVPAIIALEGAQFEHIPADKRFLPSPDKKFIVRSDTGKALGLASDQYQPHQPAEVLDWFQRYISVDERFKLDVAGSLKGGAIIWATALFNGGIDIGGDKHIARVLMTTTFDATGATINKATTTRVVCNNTLDVALADKRAVVRTTHRSKFDAARVGRELAQLAQGFASYKAMGDALSQNEMSKAEVSDFFKQCLDIPFDAKEDDVSARKLNQFKSLNQAYKTTAAEGSTGSAWAALQAITRYVDHDRSARGDNETEARFASAQFGSGAALKGKAMELLAPRVADKVPVIA